MVKRCDAKSAENYPVASINRSVRGDMRGLQGILRVLWVVRPAAKRGETELF